jgi:hypothetical protein
MSVAGQKQTSDCHRLMSAIPPKADIDERWFNVRFVPITDIARCVVENKQFRHNYASVRWKSLLGFCVGGAFADIALIANAMKHPARSDFHTVVTAAGVSVTFKPTNSTYSFFRFLEAGALSRSQASNTRGAILAITLLMKFKIWRSKLRQDTPRSILVRFKMRFIGESSPRKRNASRNQPLSPKVSSGLRPSQIRRTRTPPICACWPRSKNGS